LKYELTTIFPPEMPQNRSEFGNSEQLTPSPVWKKMAASLTEVLARQIFRDRGLKLKLLRGPNEEL